MALSLYQYEIHKSQKQTKPAKKSNFKSTDEFEVEKGRSAINAIVLGHC